MTEKKDAPDRGGIGSGATSRESLPPHYNRISPFEDQVGAGVIAEALGGKRVGDQWLIPCVAHEDSEPSLAVKDGVNGMPLVHCFGGCPQSAVIDKLRRLGLWPEPGQRPPAMLPRATPSALRKASNINKDYALRVWREAVPAEGTLVEVYLRSRGIGMIPPDSLRFAPALLHQPSKARWPAMVALVVNGVTGEPQAIHRTYLARDGSGKAPVDPPKMMLGSCRGGVVRLAPASDSLVVAEGIETGLSFQYATGDPVWVGLSAPGIKSLQLPSSAQNVVIAADPDRVGVKAAEFAGRRWEREGRTVRIWYPPEGLDANAVLMREDR